MAVQCPQCNTESSIDFGMAQCDNCQAVFYVNLDGSVSVSDGASEEPVAAEPSLQTFDSVEDLQNSIQAEQNLTAQTPSYSQEVQGWGNSDSWDNADNLNDWNAEPENHPLDEFIEFPQTENASSVESDYSETAEAVDSESFEAESLESSFQSESDMDQEGDEENHDSELEQYDPGSPEEEVDFGESNVSETIEEESVNDPLLNEEQEEEQVMSPQEHLKDVVAFGNSDKSQARHGILYYNLSIEGIDTSEERKALTEILSNRHLMLSVEDLIKKIEDGKLLIESLNPVKASVIVSELEMSGMAVRWTQGAINE